MNRGLEDKLKNGKRDEKGFLQNKKAKIEIFVRPNRACEFALVRRYLLGSRCLQRNEV